MSCLRCGESAVDATGICGSCGLRQPRPAATADTIPYQVPASALASSQPRYLHTLRMPGSTPPPTRRGIAGLGRAAVIMTGGTMALLACLAAVCAWRYTLLKATSDVMTRGVGSIPDDSVLHAEDRLLGACAALSGLAFLATGVVVVCWFHTARGNAETYFPARLTLGRRWAVGAWFVPFAGPVLALIVALDIHRGTTARPGSGRRPSGGALTRLWWGLWAAGSLGLAAGFALSGEKEYDLGDPLRHLHTLQITAAAVLPGLALLIAAGFAMIGYIRKISRLQTARAAEPYAGGAPRDATPAVIVQARA